MLCFQIVAHGIHSLYLEDIREIFEPNAPGEQFSNPHLVFNVVYILLIQITFIKLV